MKVDQRILVGVFCLFLSACSGGGSSSGGSTAATGGTVAPGSSTPPTGSVGPLTQKAYDFEAIMQAQHMPQNLAQDVALDASGNVVGRGGPSRCLWTGIYAVSQAQRFEATGDPQALANMENALRGLHDLAKITGTPGVIARGFDTPQFEPHGIQGAGAYSAFNYDKGSPSRDQYGGWFYGVGMCWDHIQDPQLKADLRQDVRDICDLLMAEDLRMRAPWNGQVEVMFDLHPGRYDTGTITPQKWAKVDDFPFNLLVQAIPYDADLADALANAQIPPIRTGEAIRAVFFFTVAEHVTGDARYGNYKNDMLTGPRNFKQAIDDNLTILDDALMGRNLPAVEKVVRQLFAGIAGVMQDYLNRSGKSPILALLGPPIIQNLGNWFADLAVDLLDWLHNPNNQQKLQDWTDRINLLSTVLRLIGLDNIANPIDDFMSTYGNNLNHQGLVDAANSMRSYLGANLTAPALASLVQLEQDPTLVASYRSWVDRRFADIALEKNSWENLIHHGYGATVTATDVPDALFSLDIYPTDMSMREQDLSNWPGLVVSPWPDRFGRVGNIATNPIAFPINERSPDIFPWRAHPRQIRRGSNSPNLKIAPMGYIVAYWMARDLGVITDQD